MNNSSPNQECKTVEELEVELIASAATTASLAAEVARRRRTQAVDPFVLVRVLAAELGLRDRSIRDAGRRGELKIEGPRAARVVRRSEADRWIASRGISKRDTKPSNDREAARSALDRAAARMRRAS